MEEKIKLLVLKVAKLGLKVDHQMPGLRHPLEIARSR